MAINLAINPTNWTMDFFTKIPGGLKHGTSIRVIGEIIADRFNIDIQTGPKLEPCDDKNIHFDVRPNINVIVRTHLQRGQWGAEERYGGCPIRFNEPFSILILAQYDCFKISVDNTDFCEFKHRIPLSAAQFIRIKGSVRIDSVNVLEPSSVNTTFPLVDYHSL